MTTAQSNSLLNTLARWPRSFTLEESLQFADAETPAECILSRLTSDSRFIRLNVPLDEQYHFLPEYTSFRWFSYLSLRLAGVRQFRLSEHQFTNIQNQLAPGHRWSGTPVGLFQWGKSLGFVSQSLTQGDYIFPLAFVLSRLPPRSLRLARDVLSDLAEWRMHNASLKQLLEESVQKGLSQFDDRVFNIIRAREGLSTGRKSTLEEIGSLLGISRERVRQLEENFWKPLITGHMRWGRPFLIALLCDVMDRSGSLLLGVNAPEALRRTFLAKCCNIPQVILSSIGYSVLGLLRKDLASLTSASWFPDEIDSEAIEGNLQKVPQLALIDTDIHTLAQSTARYRRKQLTVKQRVYLALRDIGKPAHYADVTHVHNTLFPEWPATENSVHAALRREISGVAWLGVRGTFALKEWGFERPSKKLFDAVAQIVRTRHTETGRPVAFAIILGEIGRYRQVVKPSSIAMAAHLNPFLQEVSRNYFIPRDRGEHNEDGISAERLDEILQEFLRRSEGEREA
jgi:hypothetical protein